MSRRWPPRMLVPLAITCGLLSITGLVVSPVSAQENDTSMAGGTNAPDFVLDTLDGDAFRLRDHRGQVVILNFWATWCPPCRQEVPAFVSLQREFGERGVQFVGIALERDAGVEAVRTFAEEMNVNYPLGLGDGTIARKYGGIPRVPTTIVIGPEGKIRGRVSGRVTESMLRPGLKKLLKEAS